jgi:hypothetical protein
MISGSLHTRMSSGTGLAGYLAFLSSIECVQGPFGAPGSIFRNQSLSESGELFFCSEFEPRRFGLDGEGGVARCLWSRRLRRRG